MDEVADLVIQVEQVVTPVYLVGGTVRDVLQGVKTADLDFATPLLPDQVEVLVKLAGLHPHTVGKRFGTVGFTLSGYQVEVTTFRTEKYLAGSRKPEVEFVTDITHDLGRRDFTVNAMAWRKGKLIDPYGGQADLATKTIRAVGPAGERFREDPLRVLRAARFVAQLGFNLDPATAKAATSHATQILEVSKERWVQELDKLLLSPQVSSGLQALADTRLLTVMLPELALQVEYDQHSPYHELDLWEHTKRVVVGVPADLTLRWAALLHDIGKPFVRVEKPDRSTYAQHELIGRELVLKIGQYLRWSKKRIAAVAQLVSDHMQPDSPLHAADTAAKRA